jgi:hypothetical protein
VSDRSENAPPATELAAHFTVLNYDRRGRGQSGDTALEALGREIDDLEALSATAGGRRTPSACRAGRASLDPLSHPAVALPRQDDEAFAVRADGHELGAVLCHAGAVVD